MRSAIGAIWSVWLICSGAVAWAGTSDDVDPAAVRRHVENLGSRFGDVRARAAAALVAIGDPALPALEACAQRDRSRRDVAGDLIDQIRWDVDLCPRPQRSEAPPPELLDLSVLEDLGLPPRARRNPRLVEALVRKMRQWDEDAVRPTGETPRLTGDLVALDRMRAGRDTPFDEVETRAGELLEEYRTEEEQGRIHAAVAHVYGQSGCEPRTVLWARRALELPLEPEVRLRMYEYIYSATLLATRPSSARETPEGRRALLRPALFGLREAERYDLPAERPELPSISVPPDDSPASRRAHRRQVQARVVARFLREMVTFRDIHLQRVVTHATRTPAERAELLPLLDDPTVTRALAGVLRREADPANGLAIARAAQGSP